jgi:excisionase family DNA binding protein
MAARPKDGARLLTIEQTADVLAVSRRTVEYMLADGRLAWVRVNGPTSRRLVPAASIDAFVEQLVAGSTPARKAAARKPAPARKPAARKPAAARTRRSGGGGAR